MKITFKDGRCIENGIINVSVSNMKKEEGYVPVINITFDENIGFSDVEDIITSENVTTMTIESKSGTVRTLEGFDKVYMVENISDIKHSFHVSIDKGDNNIEESNDVKAENE